MLFVKRLATAASSCCCFYIWSLLSAIAVAYSTYWNRQLLNSLLYSELSVRDKAQAGEWVPVDSRAEHLDRP
ncbi:cell division protein FtsL [Klebsiella pneumoniae]